MSRGWDETRRLAARMFLGTPSSGNSTNDGDDISRPIEVPSSGSVVDEPPSAAPPSTTAAHEPALHSAAGPALAPAPSKQGAHTESSSADVPPAAPSAMTTAPSTPPPAPPAGPKGPAPMDVEPATAAPASTATPIHPASWPMPPTPAAPAEPALPPESSLPDANSSPAAVTDTSAMAAGAVAPAADARLDSGIVYDSRMMLHRTLADETHPERPERIARIYDLLQQHGCVKRMRHLVPREAVLAEVKLVHSEELWNQFEELVRMPQDELREYSAGLEQRASLYLNPYSTFCARISCGCVLEMCDAVASRRVRNGFAVVRPPGHHAEPTFGTGFCLYNNVAIATRWLRERYPEGPNRVRRVLILDWDVHHGNGTQRAFWDDNEVLYISLHRYENGTYYPGGTFGSVTSVGGENALGTSVNIPWPCAGMTDGDYVHAFQQCVMPIATEFGPDMVIISAGFDAAEGDQLGACHVSPRGYAYMTHQLAALANGRLVVALEGGYNVEAIAASALAVTRVILGDPLPPLPAGLTCSSAGAATVTRVQRAQAPYWKSMAACAPSVQEPVGDYVTLGALLLEHQLHEQTPPLMPLPLPGATNASGTPDTLCSPNVLDAQCGTLIVYVHDLGGLHMSDTLPCASDGPAAYVADGGSSQVVRWALGAGHALVSMCTGNTLPISDQRNHEHDRAMQTEEANAQRNALRARVLYLWDNVVAVSPARHVVLLGHGTGCDALVHLVGHRAVRDKVRAAILVLATNPIPLVPKNRQELRQWYWEHSRVYCPHDHPLYAFGEQKTSGKRLGRTQQCQERHPEALLPAVLGDMAAFIEAQVKGARAAASANGAAPTEKPAALEPAAATA